MEEDKQRRSQKKSGSLFKKILIIIGLIILAVAVIFGVGIYRQFLQVSQELHQPVDRPAELQTEVSRQVDVSDKELPISVLIMGIDTGAEGRTEQGRSDVMIYSVVDPLEDKTLMVSIPRDSYTEIIGRGTMEKINHAYAYGGPEMAMATTENYLQEPVDYYVAVDMAGLVGAVDVIGGITVYNDLAFSQSGYDFPVGELQLNGDQTLAYVRNRYDDPKGDVGRQGRQRQVIMATINKLVSTVTIGNYQEYIDALAPYVRTNFEPNDYLSLALNYRNSFDNIESIQLGGEPAMIDQIYYSISSEEQLNRVREPINNALKID